MFTVQQHFKCIALDRKSHLKINFAGWFSCVRFENNITWEILYHGSQAKQMKLCSEAIFRFFIKPISDAIDAYWIVLLHRASWPEIGELMVKFDALRRRVSNSRVNLRKLQLTIVVLLHCKWLKVVQSSGQIEFLIIKIYNIGPIVNYMLHTFVPVVIHRSSFFWRVKCVRRYRR